MENGTSENHLGSACLSPKSPISQVFQEKLESQPLTANNASPLPIAPTNPSQKPLSTFLSGGQCDEIISSKEVQFKLKPPTLGVSSLSMEYIYEIATRLLFLTVDWARSIQSFCSLESTDQLVLLQSTWSDLFMLGVAQCSSSFPLSPLLTLAAVRVAQSEGTNQDHKSTDHGTSMLDKIMSVKDLLFSLEKLELDSVE